MMILSGKMLAKYIQSYEQLDEPVTPHFTTIKKIRRDKEQLTKLLFAFADQVDIEIEQICTQISWPVSIMLVLT
jgi:hypothetical protein